MARVRSALKAVRLASWRDVQTFGSIIGQNLFFFIILVGLQPESAELFAIILALVMAFPLSSDPMERIPKDRWLLWPLTSTQRAVVRAVSLAFSPLVWIAAFLLFRGEWRTAGLFLSVVAVLRCIVFLWTRSVRLRTGNFSQWIPKPPGLIGFLMTLQWREILSTLDPYMAALLAGLTLAYKIWGKPLDSSALQIMSLIAAIAMSTMAQVLLSLDGAGALRYRLMPIRGWQILLSKDLAYLSVLLLLTAPLDWISGLFAGLSALTIGHYRSVYQYIPQARWRFTSGVLFPDGLIQTVVLIGVGLNVHALGVRLMLPCITCWIASVFLFGWLWDRKKPA